MSDWWARLQAEGDPPVADEHGTRDHPVGQVVASGLPGIVEHEDVARLDVVLEVAQDRPDRESTAPGVDRDPVRLGDEPSVRPAHEAGEVVGLAEYRATRGAHHHLAHLPGDVVQAVLGEGELYGVEGHGLRLAGRSVFDLMIGVQIDEELRRVFMCLIQPVTAWWNRVVNPPWAANHSNVFLPAQADVRPRLAKPGGSRTTV